MEILFMVFTLVISSTYANRFLREELGISDRLRFTCGHYNVYNCSVTNNILYSNLKIGMYLHNQKTNVKYYINDTINFKLESSIVKDFLFAVIKVERLNAPKVVHLIAKNVESGKVIDDAILKIHSSESTNVAPKFLNDSITTINVFEDSFIGSAIGRLMVDSSMLPVVFHICREHIPLIDKFSVSTAGWILLTKKLDYNVKRYYQFKVCVSVLGSKLIDSILVKISLVSSMSKKTKKPRFLRNKYIESSMQYDKTSNWIQPLHTITFNFSLSEFAPDSTIIGCVNGGYNNLNFEMKDNAHANLFLLDAKSGILSVKDRQYLDYESTKFYQFSVHGSSGNNVYLIATIQLNVLDANDNAPVFSKNKYVANISESTGIGSFVLKLEATDQDSFNNGTVYFVLSNESPVPFEVAYDGVIKVSQNLDLLTMADIYYLYVKAIDSGDRQRLESEAVVEIHINPVNSHQPIMMQSKCEIVLTFDSTSSDLYTFNAVDQDIGDRLSYELKTDSELFRLNSTGTLKLIKDISPENAIGITLHVVASDGVHESKKSVIHVKFKNSKRNVRCNENVEYTKVMVQIKARKMFTTPTIKPPVSVKPEGTILFVTAPNSIVVPENTELNKKLTQFHATDSVRNCYGILLYTIESGNNGGKFQIDLFNGTLYLLNKVDRENKGFYVLKIKASDLHGHSTTKSVEVIIDDVNDNAPVFSNNSFYQIRDFDERKLVNNIIFTVTAKDPDFGSNGIVTYSLLNPSQMFKLNEITGELQLLSSLKNYPYNEYFIEVKASDQSQEHSMYSFAVVHIITKTNNNSQPLCLTDHQQIEVPINMPEGVVVGRVFGYEKDFEKHGLLKYSIVDSSVLTYFHDYFSLDEDTGLIKLKRPLSQREKGFVFSIAVKITDGKFLTKCHLYKIIVDSYSVNKLQFIHHDTFPKVVTVSDDVSKSSLVTLLHAFLNDNSSEAIINFELVDGSGIGVFSVDRLIGSIYVQNNDFSKSFYWLTIQAYLDTDTNVFTNTHLLIVVKDTKVKQLFFNPSVYHITLHHTTNPKQFVVQLYSTNGRDEYNSQESKYAIYAGDESGNFMMTKDGQIYTNKVLPVGQFKLNVTVCAKSNSSAVSHGFVNVDVISNMMSPIFYDSKTTMQTVHVFETQGSLNPPFLFQPLAYNPNGEHNRLSYSLSEEDNFKIDSQTGVVTADSLEANERYFISVIASNAANQTADSYYMVDVIKKPVISTKISFKKQRYSFTIKENRNNVEILDLSKEVDHSSGVQIFFYIISGNDDLKFFIAPGSAQLAVLQALDYEQQQQHDLQILAFDGKVFARTSVQITVINLNDNPLTVSQPCFEARIQENTHTKSRLITVQVIDPDRFSSDFNHILINNLNKESSFHVSQDGGLSVKSGIMFDRELQNEHIVTVVAGSENDNATYCVKVLVEDLNDNKPNFTKSLYQVNIYDTASMGFRIAAVYAYDKDTGSNARLTYRLKTKSSLFEIIGRTGVLLVKNSLLDESGKMVTLDVEVSDGGQPSYSSSCQVQINILNDIKKLKFAQSHYQFEVAENLQAGSLVTSSIRVNVSTVYYEIARKENECFHNFWIDYTTGILLTSAALDFDDIQNCSFVVLGLLYGKVVAAADVFVEIIDMNDNAPIFMQGSYFGSCKEGQKSNSKVFTTDGSALILNANDKDSGRNGRLKYNIVEKTVSIYFVINEETGEILTNIVLDYENHPHKFEFHVIVFDQGNPSYSAIVPVTINLINVNDKMPEFWKPDVVKLLLPTYNGAIVYQLSARDADMLPNTAFIYGVGDSNGIFDVNSITGDVLIKDQSLLKYQEFVVIRPTVSDGVFTSETILQFQLSRYSDNTEFKFLTNSIETNIMEHEPSVQVVAVINPIGYSPGEQLTYKIINAAPNFHINPLSGILTTSPFAVFDRELVNSYVIHVEVSKKDCVNMVARTSVNVSVDDVNDNAPVFSRKRYYRAVNIDAVGGLPLLTVHATDADLGENAMIRYRLISNEEYFDCNELSGIIVLRKGFIKSQTKPKYFLKVQAFDNGTNILRSEAIIEIPVINKDQPMFTNNYNIIVSEDAQIGRKLMQIKARGRGNRQVYYYVSHGDVYEQFTVGFTTGELIVSGRLDYSVQSTYSLIIKAIDSLTGSWSEAECNIQVIDINNHIPMFEQSAYEVEIFENIKIGSSIIQLSAVDGDHGSNAKLSYSLISQSDNQVTYFGVNHQTGLIKLQTGLDAETEPYHQLSVIVTDQGVPKQSSFTTLSVKVVDINDNPPEFVDQRYEFIVDSYSVSGKQFIGKVHAIDRDVNDKLIYSIMSNQKLISIDKQMGTLYALAHPRHSTLLKLNVSVSDTVHHVTTIVKVLFTAQNRFVPVMKRKLLASVEEGSGLTREVVTVLKAVDHDKGKFGHVLYQIDSQSDGDYFTLDENGILRTNGKLFDREKQNTFYVNARATDDGGLFALTTILINVTDINDNVPVFEFSHYHSNVRTSQMSADSLLHVIAYDPDEGSNSDLTYTTEIDSRSGPIIIDKLNGLVSLAGSPKGAMYQLPVKATDNGFPAGESLFAEVQIAVKGWSDLLFTFSNRSYHATVPENTSLKKVLLNVAVQQNRFNGSVRYSLVDGNLDYTKASHYFKINSKSGKIKLIKTLDFENIPHHKLMVQATTTGDEYLAMCFVHIHVKNINDNSPKFLPRKYEIHITENIEVNKKILKVVAFDKDQPNDRLRYSFESVQTFFSIHSTSGWIKVAQKLDHEKQSIYQLLVKVFDKGGRSDTAKVIINLVDINDSPPQFLQQEYLFEVAQDTLPREHFSCVKAKDADVGGILNYFVDSPNNGEFAVDISSGCISLLKPMSKQSYNVTLLAYDGVHTARVNVKIQSININRNYPHCLKSYYNISAKENVGLASSLVKIEAEDEDVGDELRYTIQGDGVGKFKVIQETGILITTGHLDFESNKNYKFKVVVADKADHSCMSDIFLTLIDVNDNPPTFSQQVFIATVRENATKSVVITQVKATDLDSFDNRKITYQLLHNFDDVFAIGDRGIVTLHKPSFIRQNRISNYSMIVKASDSGYPPLSSTVHLQIIVLSVTDTPPRFEKLSYVFAVKENRPSGTLAGVVKAGATSNLRTEVVLTEIINDPSGIFQLAKQGNLMVMQPLDFEDKSTYSFIVKAWFQKIPSLSSTVNVKVQVVDVNDHTPTFQKESFFKQIDENVRSGTYVLYASATDADGSLQNSQLTYQIVHDGILPFAINTITGLITVNGSIDFELQHYYSFHVLAEDSSSPKLSANVPVLVNITDLNDNAPTVSETNASVIIQEGQLPGSTLLKLGITDQDSSSNAAPFTCELLLGDAEKFEVATENNVICVIRSKTLFKVAEKALYDLSIRVSDSGSPKRYSDSSVKIIVVEESYHQPVIQDPKIFFVIVSKPYGVAKIGKVNVFDKDENDVHQFKITNVNHKAYFSIQPMTGIIEGKPFKGSYTLSIEVSDGKFTDSRLFNVVVNEIDKDVKIKSVPMILSGVDAQQFVIYKMYEFVNVLARITAKKPDDIFIWSVKDYDGFSARQRRAASSQIIIAVAVHNPSKKGSYIERTNLKNDILNGLEDFENMDIEVSIPSLECSHLKCPVKQKCLLSLTPEDEIISLHMPSGYMNFKKEEKCYCTDGREGPLCYPSNSCFPNPCKVGERCISSGGKYHCDCVDERHCDKTSDSSSIMLHGTSYVSYQLRKDFDVLFNSLSMYFRTEIKNSILFYAFGKDFFIVEIEYGYIKVRFDFGSGVGSLNNKKKKYISDGNWHKVLITRSKNFVSLSLDDDEKEHGRAPGDSANINVNGHAVVFGAGVSRDGSPFSGFKGCMKGIKLNGNILPYSGKNDVVKSVDVRHVTFGCQDSNMCAVTNCGPFADCINTMTSYTCVCVKGHYGRSCTSDYTCANMPCQNQGTCTYELVHGKVSYKCNCMHGFTGAQCHIPLRACAQKPCLNGGKCTSLSSTGYSCECLSGYAGTNCEVNENPCLSNPCYNGAKCINLYNDYKCDCRPVNKRGKQCAAGEYCKTMKCQNGGSCMELQDGGQCNCKDGYTGAHCEEDINECLIDTPCMNGHGICVNTYGSYYCNCSDGAIDKSCAAAAVAKEKTLPVVVIAAAGGGIIVSILILIAVICFVKKRRTKRSDLYNSRNTADERKYPLDRYQSDAYELVDLYPPNPPPRGFPVPPDYFDGTDQASAAAMCPMVSFSGTSSENDCIKQKLRLSNRLGDSDVLEDDDLRYHWDYSEVPEDVINSKMSREGSRIGLTNTDQYYPEEGFDYVDIPKIPERPASRRSSIPGYSECETDIPELPELPNQVRLSRQSLRSGTYSPSTLPRLHPDLTSREFQNRYSLMSDEDDTPYFRDVDGGNAANMAFTKPYVRTNYDSGTDIDDDGYTVTSMNSDDEDDATETDPLDPENTRKLERDIKKLFKDLQKRTEED